MKTVLCHAAPAGILRATGVRRSARSIASLGALLLVPALLVVLLQPQAASAHTVTIGQSKIREESGIVYYDLAVDYVEVAKRVGVTPLPPQASDAERADTLRAAHSELSEYIGSSIRVFRDGVGCADSLESTDVMLHEEVTYAVLSLEYLCPGSSSGSYEVHYSLFFGLVHPHRLSHWNIADYSLGGEQGSFVFERSDPLLVVEGRTLFASAGALALTGFEHILSRLDYVLFILVLLLGARSVREALKVVAAVTAAHILALTLAAFGLVHVPAGVIGFLTASSVGYVAIANIFWRDSSHRFIAIVGFGLVHGLSFASVLNFSDHMSFSMVASFLAFVAGLESGQAVVVVGGSLVLLLARRLYRKRRAGEAVAGHGEEGAQPGPGQQVERLRTTGAGSPAR